MSLADDIERAYRTNELEPEHVLRRAVAELRLLREERDRDRESSERMRLLAVEAQRRVDELRMQSGPTVGYSADLRVNPADGQDYGHLPGDKPGPIDLGPWQGGLSNDELLREWKLRLPNVEPTDRELSAFALGVEAGYKVVWMQQPASTKPVAWRWKELATLGWNYATRREWIDPKVDAEPLYTAPQPAPIKVTDAMLDVLCNFADYDSSTDCYTFNGNDMRAALRAALAAQGETK